MPSSSIAKEKQQHVFNTPAPINGRKVISREQTAIKVGIHIGTTYKWKDSNPAFPLPIKLSPGRTVYFEDEIDAYLNSRPRT